MSNFGIPDPTITVMPDYSGSIKAARDPDNLPQHYLPYAWMEKDVDRSSPIHWHDPMARATLKVDESMQALRGVLRERVPIDKGEMGQGLKQALTDARRAADTYMNHDPSHPSYAKNEVPQWTPDNKLIPAHEAAFDKAAGAAKPGSKLVFDKPAQALMEDLLFVEDAKAIGYQHWEGIDDAARKITMATDLMTYGASPTGKPEPERAFKMMREAKRDMKGMLRNAGAQSAMDSRKERIMSVLADLTPNESRNAIIASAAGVALIAGATAAGVAFHDN